MEKREGYFYCALFILGLLAPFIGGRFTGIGITLGITMVAVLGLQITTGVAGQINLGQSAFMGFGAFGAAFCAVHYGWPLLLCLVVGGITAAAAGVIFGFAAVRIKGFYLALTTIAAQYIFTFLMLKLPTAWFGGSQGLRLSAGSIFGWKMNTDIRIYYLVLIVTAVGIFCAQNVVRSRTGRAMIALRERENAAEVIGINVVKYKLVAFLIGAFYAGVAGALWAFYVRYVQVDQFTLWLSVWYTGMIIIGGVGTVGGAVVGTIVIRALMEALTYAGPLVSAWAPTVGSSFVLAGTNIILGGLIIIFVIRWPGGIFGVLKTKSA